MIHDFFYHCSRNNKGRKKKMQQNYDAAIRKTTYDHLTIIHRNLNYKNYLERI